MLSHLLLDTVGCFLMQILKDVNLSLDVATSASGFKWDHCEQWIDRMPFLFWKEVSTLPFECERCCHGYWPNSINPDSRGGRQAVGFPPRLVKDFMHCLHLSVQHFGEDLPFCWEVQLDCMPLPSSKKMEHHAMCAMLILMSNWNLMPRKIPLQPIRCAKTCIVIPSSIFVVFLQAVSICTNNEQLNE